MANTAAKKANTAANLKNNGRQHKERISPQERRVLDYQSSQNKILLHTILQDYRPLLMSIAAKYAGTEREDLIQVGYIGLLNAVNRFKAQPGCGFTTYAQKMIEGEICHHLRDNLVIRIPRWAHKLNRQIEEIVTEFAHDHQRMPNLSEIAEAANLTEESVQEILKAREAMLCIPIDNRGDEEDFNIQPEKIHTRSYQTFQLPIEDRIALEGALGTLSDIQRRVIFYLFYHDLSQSEAAKKLGITQKKVSRALSKALKNLHEILNREIW